MSTRTNECKFCEKQGEEVDCEYLNIVMCYECFKKQMSHYMYDKPLEDITEEEDEELVDFMSDINYKV